MCLQCVFPLEHLDVHPVARLDAVLFLHSWSGSAFLTCESNSLTTFVKATQKLIIVSSIMCMSICFRVDGAVTGTRIGLPISI